MKTTKICIIIILLFSLCVEAYAYCIMSCNSCGCPQTGTGWPSATATFYSKGYSGSNSTYDDAFVEALNNWNNLSDFSYSSTEASTNPCSYDSVRGWTFDSTNCGSPFGATTLAITTTWVNSNSPSIDTILDADIVFNIAFSWDVHNGSGSNSDFRRVATHELGHALGLDHEDDVPSIMSTNITHTIEVPQPDDIDGLIALYGGSALMLDQPTGITASANGDTVTLSWNSVSRAEGYKLYYGYSSGNYAGSVDLGNTTSQSFSGIPDETYYLVITAYADSAESSYSSEESVTVSTTVNLSAPTGVTASASGDTVTLSWNSVSGAEGYILYYGYSSGNYEDSVDLGNTTSQSFSGIPDGTYYLVIAAYASSTESNYSNEANVSISVTESVQCSDFTGNWSGTYSETFCDGFSYSGSWTANVTATCSITAYSEGVWYEGTITGNVLSASGFDPECGPASVVGTFTGNSMSGTYTYSSGGSGSFEGSKD